MAAVGVIGSVVLVALPLLTHGRVGPAKPGSVPTIAWGLALATLASTALVIPLTPEPVTPERRRQKVVWSDYWQLVASPTALRLVIGDFLLVLAGGVRSSTYVFFFHGAKGFSLTETTTLVIFFTGAALVGVPLWTWLARRIGKHRSLMIGCATFAATQVALAAVPSGRYWLAAAMVAASGVGHASFLVLVRAMLADFADELRLEQGRSRVSLLYAFVGMTMKAGAALSAVITTAVLAFVGFKAREHAVNTSAAINGLELTFLFGPTLFALLGSSLFLGYRLDARRHADIRTALDARDGLIAAAPAGANEAMAPAPQSANSP
jgi:Na+/melibiose symporter-like transporter